MTVWNCVLALAVVAASSVETSAGSDNSLLWGPYRPGLYFGMRPRVPESLLTGLMWYESKTLLGLGALRHECTNTDQVDKFGWTAYDARLGGQQVVYDTQHGVNLTTELVKSKDGLSWDVRVRGEQAADNVLTLVYYAGLESAAEGTSDFLKLSGKTKKLLTPQGLKGDIELTGSAEKLGGPFKLTVFEGNGSTPTHSHLQSTNKPAANAHYFSLQIPAGSVWRAQDVFMTLMQDQVNKFLETFGEEETDVPVWSMLSLADTDMLGGNTHMIQKTFKGPFEFTVSFKPSHAQSAVPAGSTFDEQLDAVLRAQKDRFDASLAIQEPYNQDPKFYAFAREMISSIEGGVGYFHGDSLIKNPQTGVVEPGPVRELFTGTPSRTFFPRGFYWDEGLNALALMDYDTDLVLQIINSWFATMNDDGWIEREQILGDEARARVPPEFQAQDPTVANPPTLVMALAHLGTVKNDPKLVKLLREMYPALQKHFEWFRHTQSGETLTLDREYPSKEAYRWRGRTPTHILASGLDDYPRAPEPNDGELHVDLVAWVGAMAESLARVADILGESEDAAHYRSIIRGVQRNLESVFWSPEANAYCDLTMDEYEEDVHVCHIGYVTHLPFMLKLVPETSDAHLLALLDELSDPEQLWSVAGIRSLSKQDEFFGKDENYWRGAVWNNMNFLALDALQFYARPESKSSPRVKDRAARIYTELRRNVVNNIYEQWVETGYVWESYDGLTGAAKGAKAFTGWAGLVANIMAMPDKLEVDPVHDEI